MPSPEDNTNNKVPVYGDTSNGDNSNISAQNEPTQNITTQNTNDTKFISSNENNVVNTMESVAVASGVVTSKNLFIYKVIVGILILIIIGISGFIVADKVFGLFHTTEIKASQEEMKDPATAKKTIEKESGIKISDEQAKEISETMNDDIPNTPNYKEPERIVEVKGKEVKNEGELFRKKTGGDVVVTTDPNKPTEVPKIDPNKSYTLEQRSYKLFPDQQWSVTTFNDGSLEVGYDKKVRVFGDTAYVGVSVLDDKQDGGGNKIKYGVKLTFPR